MQYDGHLQQNIGIREKARNLIRQGCDPEYLVSLSIPIIYFETSTLEAAMVEII